MPRLSLGLGVQTQRKVGGGAAIPISGLSLWLKADSGVTLAGSDVVLWADQSGNGNNFTESDYPVQRYNNIIGSYPAMLLNGGRLDGADIVTAKTIYAVVRTLNFQVEAYSVILECTGGSLYSAVFDNEWGSYFAGERSSINTLLPNTSAIIATISNDGETYEFRRDGQNILSESDGGGFYSRSSAYLGNDGSGGQPANVYLAELIVYNRVPTAPEISQIENYLNVKYSIY